MESILQDEEMSAPVMLISGFWRRFLAFALDGLLLGFCGFMLGLVFEDRFSGMLWEGRLIGFGIALLYFTSTNSSLTAGQTFGKRLAGIRVVGSEGKPIGLGRAFIRSAILELPFFLNGWQITFSSTTLTTIIALFVFSVSPAIIYLIIFNRETRRSVHDLIAKTYVVLDESTGLPAFPPLWVGHRIVLACCPLLTIIALVSFSSLSEQPNMQAASSLINELSDSGECITNLSWGSSTFSQADGDESTSDWISATVRLKSELSELEKEEAATRLAGIIIAKYPNAEDYDNVRILMVRGFDIGIASKWAMSHFQNPPSVWLEKKGTLNYQ